jgi:hypothetical protein
VYGPARLKWDFPELKSAIKAHFSESRETNGHRRIKKCLVENEVLAGLKLIIRMMHEWSWERCPGSPFRIRSGVLQKGVLAVKGPLAAVLA